MFLLMLVATLLAAGGAYMATLEARRSAASGEALAVLVAVGLAGALLAGASAPIAVPAIVGAMLGTGAALIRVRRPKARPKLRVVTPAPRGEATTRRAA